jgi:hypothetical protein
LLAEEFDSRIGRGSIVQMDLDDSQITAPALRSAPELRSAIDEGIHMSYPHLFEHKGAIYCTPEAYRKRSVDLYRFDLQNDKWIFAANLIRNFAAVDPTPFEYAGRWWMFCTNFDDDVETKLYLWHAPELEGPWEPHVANPVKTDVRSSRPAGRPFVFEGALYRPAQDSSRSYGCGISINEITCLTTHQFAETPVRHIAPISGSRYREGIHTLVGCGSVTVVDGKRYILTLGIILRPLKKIRNRLLQLCTVTATESQKIIGTKSTDG